MDADSSAQDTGQSTGHTDSGFEAVRDAFDAMLQADPGYSAQVTAIWQGRTVVDLAGGPHLGSDAITGVFSSSKGVAASVIGLLLDRGLLDLESPVASYWPEFAARGKGRITVRQLLAHRAGIIGIEEGFSPEQLADSVGAAAALAASAPLWQPDSAHGYHALTIGIIMEELVRRTTGKSLQSVYESDIRAPRAIDFYLGLPESQESRFHAVLPPVVPAELPSVTGEPGAAPLPPAPEPAPAPALDTIQSVAFNALHTASAPDFGAMGPNSRAMRAAGAAAIHGIGSARGLAELYGAVLGSDGTEPLISADTIEEMSRQHSFGVDRVLGHQSSFGLVYMKPHPFMEFGSFRAFGHDGAGGALAFADPLYDLAFGYIPMPMQLPGGADAKSIELSQLIRGCIRALQQ